MEELIFENKPAIIEELERYTRKYTDGILPYLPSNANEIIESVRYGSITVKLGMCCWKIQNNSLPKEYIEEAFHNVIKEGGML